MSEAGSGAPRQIFGITDDDGELPAGDPPPERRPVSGRTLAVLLTGFLGFCLLAVGVAFFAGFGRDEAAPFAGPPPAVPVPRAGPSATAALPPPPGVEPVELADVSQERARAINAAVPFAPVRGPAAVPVVLGLSGQEAARARDCLAAAAWYEAGDDPLGQQAVMQVVLNRLRHAAFPKTVCGVVFQGAERPTGCQFTFTCDGSMIRRRPSPAMWADAQALAQTAMDGHVLPAAGLATHYHTDWVVPNWSASVDKIAAIGTHLFFRWKGANGQPVAFRQAHEGSEPAIGAMTALTRLMPEPATATASGPAADPAATAPLVDLAGADRPAPGVDMAALRGNELARADPSGALFVIRIRQGEFPGTLALVGLDLCRRRQGACAVVGFLGAPGRVVSNAFGQARSPDGPPDFYYFIDRARGRELIRWNCAAMPRPDKTQCMEPGFRGEG